MHCYLREKTRFDITFEGSFFLHFRGDLILHNYNVLCGSRFAVWHGNPELSCGFQCVLMWGLKMKMNSKAAAVLLSAAMAVSLPAAASAVAISLGSPGDFTFEDLKTANGNCPGGGKGCGLLNNNSAVTMSLKNGGTFTLDSISFRLEGNGTDNTFVITDGGNAKNSISFGSPDYVKKNDYTVSTKSLGVVSSIIFTSTGSGSARFDGFGVSITPVAAASDVPPAPTSTTVSAVPVPAGGLLMLSSLAGLGFLSRRRKS